MKSSLRVAALVCIVSIFLCAGLAFAGDGLKGWEQGSEFDSLFDTVEMDKIKGYFVEYKDIAPMDGMADGVAVVVRDRDDNELVTGVLGPKAFVGRDHLAYPINEGDKIKLYGSWAVIDGKELIIATKIKYDDAEQYKVRRTEDGLAYWNMPKSELEAEQKAWEEERQKILKEME